MKSVHFINFNINFVWFVKLIRKKTCSFRTLFKIKCLIWVGVRESRKGIVSTGKKHSIAA